RLGAAEFFPGAQQAGATGEEAAEGRKCEGGAGNGFGSRVGYTIQTCDPSVSRPAVRWGPRFSSSAPPRSPAPSFDHFPFGPASQEELKEFDRRYFTLRNCYSIFAC